MPHRLGHLLQRGELPLGEAMGGDGWRWISWLQQTETHLVAVEDEVRRHRLSTVKHVDQFLTHPITIHITAVSGPAHHAGTEENITVELRKVRNEMRFRRQ